MTEIKSDSNPDKRIRSKPDNYLDNWIERQSLIEAAIPIIGKMHRKNIRILLYGSPLMTLSVIEIMQLHRKVREAEENELSEFETSIFTGEYFTPLVENYLEELEISRKDELKMQREKSKAKS